MQMGLSAQVKVVNRLVGKGGNLMVEGKMIWKKDLELLGKGVAGGVVALFGPMLLVEATCSCWSLGVGVMCLREGRTARIFTSLPPPLGTALLCPVPATGDKLLGVNVLPPLTYPEEWEVTWKSKLNNALVQLWKVYSKGWRCSSTVKLMTSLP